MAHSIPILTLYISLLLVTLLRGGVAISADNACTFHLGGKLFSLLYLQKQKPYTHDLPNNQTLVYNFCSAFVPPECKNTKSAYSFLLTRSSQERIDQNNQTVTDVHYACQRYSSNSYAHLFSARYAKDGNGGTLEYIQYTEDGQEVSAKGQRRQTVYNLECHEDEAFNVEAPTVDGKEIRIRGRTKYGCPVFEVSSIWKVFKDNWIVIGLILFVLGLHLLFFGRTTIETTIFIASFLIIFAVLGAIFTLFVSPYSSTFVIYFAFLMLLFTSTIMAYGVTKLVGLSIFFVGAILGFIIGMIVNSIFCSMFGVYSVWSLVVFQIVFTIPFGLLTFKFTDEIIIASSSLTGAYFVVRPISWIFGGFPNQFLLYEMVQTKELSGLPWPFFIYLVLIIALAIVGAMYQLIKLKRENPQEQIETNFIQQSIQQPIDLIKMKVDKLIERFQSDKEAEDYRRMRELKETDPPMRKSAPSSSIHEYPDMSQFHEIKQNKLGVQKKERKSEGPLQREFQYKQERKSSQKQKQPTQKKERKSDKPTSDDHF